MAWCSLTSISGVIKINKKNIDTGSLIKLKYTYQDCFKEGKQNKMVTRT